MNDKRIKYIGLLFLSALLLSSCASEEPMFRGVTADDDEILFFTSLPGVQSRSYADIDKNSVKNGFDVSAACLDSVTATGDTIPIGYFSTQLVKQTEGMGEAFRSDGCRWPANKGKKNGTLRFFAFFPSRAVLRDSAGVDRNDNNYFKLEYTKNEKGAIEYWMKRFKVNKDINRHSDFVTATAEGSKTDNLYSGVNLTFQHQLSKIILKAFSSSDTYDVEIAGVRIGGIATESDFSFEGEPVNFQNWNSTKIGRWIGVNQTKGCVEYIFREDKFDEDGKLLFKGDTVVSINKENCPSDSTKSASIMGRGGPALVIPYDYSVWDYSNNKTTGKDYLYFSVLLRVKERATDKTLLYPYIEGENMTSSETTDNMHVVYLSIETDTGKVMKRVYKKGSDFFEDPEFSKKYEKPVTEDIRNYGWASAIPPTGNDPKIRWNPGYQYIYLLRYSKGIGVQDPDDVFPGKPIIAPIEVTVTGTTWHTVKDFDKGENLDLDVQK